ncbi:carbonyl reductase [NADPH] 3-like [Pieris napi]|uniref:carbonyl reductase [NADPH] 3-like n=1 Tax=Pieris napi TaxID=78633 RepID=UPI001FB8FD35|nr:carbonyl reductase [NADPH] 3-like [Pieris napi]
MANKIAIVTGSNKGIGFEIVKELCKRGVGVVYLTARDIQRGQKAVQELNREGYFPKFHQLEVNNKQSVKTFADYLKKNYGEIDILINNAGVINEDFYKTSYEDSKYIIDINYNGILLTEEYIYPIIKDNGRIINISSDCGHISNLKNKYWIERLTKDNLQRDDINDFLNWFLQSVKNNTIDYNDFVEDKILSYRISKIAVCALTRIQQKEIGKNISINSLHPGFVKTNMTKGCGNFTLDEAADTPVYLALDIDQSVKGKYFWFDKTEQDWTDPNLKLYCVFDTIENQLQGPK